MGKRDKVDVVPAGTLIKARTGIIGLDEITRGGLPAGRPTLVCGGPGSGKTVLAMEFVVRGASEFDEPGVFVSFEETGETRELVLSDEGASIRSLETSSDGKGRVAGDGT